MPLKAPPAEVAAAFQALQLPEDPQQRNQTLQQFVNQAGGGECGGGTALHAVLCALCAAVLRAGNARVAAVFAFSHHPA